MQHKQEAYWFYRFLSIFYDRYVNPLFWTEDMRRQALQLARLEAADLQVIDVGSGTGFTTLGIVQHVDAAQVTCIDQSPHQMAKARAKPALQGCHFQLGDAENLPAATDRFDRYISAGSIEYWPDPQRGIQEAYRVIKPGGLALVVGPLEPGSALPRLMARLWMLFPKEADYRRWFEQAGFTDIETLYVRPHWHWSSRSEYGIAIAGRKPAPGLSPNHQDGTGEIRQERMTLLRRLQLLGRLLVGALAGFLFIPIALLGYLRSSLSGRGGKPLNSHQVGALIILLTLLAMWLWWIF